MLLDTSASLGPCPTHVVTTSRNDTAQNFDEAPFVGMAAAGSCARAPAQLLAAPSEPQIYPKTSELIQAMRSPDAGERADALAMLSEVVGSAYGEAGAELGEAVRQGGGVALLAWLLADPYDQVQQQALLVIGNLCSDSVDPHSGATKQLLLYNGAGRSLLACVFSDDPYMLILACGALQNLCYDRDWATFVVEHGAPARSSRTSASAPAPAPPPPPPPAPAPAPGS